MSEPATDRQVPAPVPQRHWSTSPLVAWCEFALIALSFWADIHGHIFLSKTLYLFPLSWISLRVRGLRWRDVGLVRFQNWKKTLLIGVACGVAMELLELFVSQPLLMRWAGKAPDLELFRALHGNVKWTLIAIAGSWTLAAFGEEMVYRGYLLNRIAGLIRSPKTASAPTASATAATATPATARVTTAWVSTVWVIALVLSSCVFGGAHLGQGITGQLENALDGLLLGAIYLSCGRSLAVPIVAHGVTDTLDVLLMFAGMYPTLR